MTQNNNHTKNFWKTLKKPFFILAPMEDVTDLVFREIIAEIGPPNVFFTEFTNTEGLISAGRGEVIRRLKYSEKQRPVVAQLWGTNPDNMRESAKLVESMGFDGIDINMGCPDKAVVKIGAGSALIENQSLAKELIDAAREGAPNIPLSVKTRIGFNKVSTEPWIKFLLEQNIDCITIHGRTKKQLSKVPTDWNEIGKAVKMRNEIKSKILIVGNGDVENLENAQEKAKRYGVDGVMIGRGIFLNPWLFTGDQAEKHTSQERMDLLLKHTDLFVKTWGKEKPFHIMKKFFKVYVKGFDGANELRQKLMESDSLEEIKAIISNQHKSCL